MVGYKRGQGVFNKFSRYSDTPEPQVVSLHATQGGDKNKRRALGPPL